MPNGLKLDDEDEEAAQGGMAPIDKLCIIGLLGLITLWTPVSGSMLQSSNSKYLRWLC